LVQKNNPKAYVGDRFNKAKQPKGDPDCRLSVKRRRNQRVSSRQAPPMPSENPVPAGTISVAEYYWVYGSGIIATKVSHWGEFLLAELKQPFNRLDVSYFFRLRNQVEERLGFKPRFGALDATFDAFYFYSFHFRCIRVAPSTISLINPSCYLSRKLIEQASTKRATLNSKPAAVTA
jgi:hypothetical protein